ncbi:MAG: TetR/AcrR family transcriptional regulator [Flavipsychrobacter sp.]|nr:TetR/AcrR family transcriptional regulator [Flavipsychrobacter sp.]
METIIIQNVSIVLHDNMEPLTKILSASSELFKQYGFKTITMDDIARRAGISKKTLYQHFANKDEVVHETMVSYDDDKKNKCYQVVEGAVDAVEAMVKMMVMMDSMFKEINPMAMFELRRFYPDTYTLFKDRLEKDDVGMMREMINRGISEGLFRKEINPDLMARLRLETAMMVLQPNLLVNERNDLLSVSLEITEHFLYGIMNAKGIELYCQYKQQYLSK